MSILLRLKKYLALPERLARFLAAEPDDLGEVADSNQVVRLGEAVVGEAYPRFLIGGTEFIRQGGSDAAGHAAVGHHGYDAGELGTLQPVDSSAYAEHRLASTFRRQVAAGQLQYLGGRRLFAVNQITETRRHRVLVMLLYTLPYVAGHSLAELLIFYGIFEIPVRGVLYPLPHRSHHDLETGSLAGSNQVAVAELVGAEEYLAVYAHQRSFRQVGVN